MGDGAANWSEGGGGGREVPHTQRAVRDAVLAGDTAAWRLWYARHFDRLAEYARWRCGGLADLADDVVQETWLTAVRRLRSFDPEKGPFFAWLCGIAANAARNALRARRRRARRTRPLEPGHETPAPGPDPAATEKAERVAAALAALPEHYEAVLRAKYLDRMTVEAIAAQRGESAKAVESLLARARQAFREAYEADL
jgi:RNA polymerase sigma-70 factor (ECF subfamily)